MAVPALRDVHTCKLENTNRTGTKSRRKGIGSFNRSFESILRNNRWNQ